MSRIKLCMLGDGGVGKTAFTIQFSSGLFVEQYDPTIEDSYRKQINLEEGGESSVVMVDILDTAGQEEFKALRDQWIVGCEGFCILYSITSKSSFKDVQEFVEQVEQAKDEDAIDLSWVLVGNKLDLADIKREVSTADGMAKAKSISPDCAFFEASAKTRVNVEEALHELVRIMRRKKKHNEDGEDGGERVARKKKQTGGLCILL